MTLDRIRNLDYVVLLCDDLERMRSFYEGTLGFPLYRALDDWCELRAGSSLLALRPRGRPYDGPGPAGAAVQLAFRVAPDEVVPCWKQLAEAGVEILEQPMDRGYGHLTLFFRDPQRNVLEIYADVDASEPEERDLLTKG